MILLGFFGLTALGAAYEILPRILGAAWPCDKLRRWHLVGSIAGLSLYFSMLLIGGLVQGIRMNNAEVEFLKVVKSTIPFIGMATLGWMIFLGAQIAFLIAIQMMVWNFLKPVCLAVCGGICCGPKAGESKSGGRA
jgi:cytochrome c oxidase cbb3-type subunit 1